MKINCSRSLPGVAATLFIQVKGHTVHLILPSLVDKNVRRQQAEKQNVVFVYCHQLRQAGVSCCHWRLVRFYQVAFGQHSINPTYCTSFGDLSIIICWRSSFRAHQLALASHMKFFTVHLLYGVFCCIYS